MKKWLALLLVFMMLLSVSALAASAEPSGEASGDAGAWDAYLAYAAAAITAQEEPDFLDMSLNALYNESNEADPNGWPFDMFVESRALFVSFEEFVETIYVPGNASGEPSGEASDEESSWNSYLAYAAAAITAQEEPDFLDMALNSLYNESNEADPDGWPFDMFVGRGLFVSYADYMATIYGK